MEGKEMREEQEKKERQIKRRTRQQKGEQTYHSFAP